MNNSSDYIYWSELHCSKDALTDTYGWFMQFLLAVLAFTCLIGKRFCEPRYARRPWLIWFYDTSKQGLGALIIHAANVWLSPHLTGNPCTWYIVNFMLDSTLGLLIIWAGIRLAQHCARIYDIPLINFGEYGKPPMCTAWVCQCILYAALATFAKSILALVLRLPPVVAVLSTLRLSPVSDPRLELAVVMLIIPFFVNILIFWVTDNFLMYHPRGVSSKIKTKVRYQSIKRTNPLRRMRSNQLTNDFLGQAYDPTLSPLYFGLNNYGNLVTKYSKFADLPISVTYSMITQNTGEPLKVLSYK